MKDFPVGTLLKATSLAVYGTYKPVDEYWDHGRTYHAGSHAPTGDMFLVLDHFRVRVGRKEHEQGVVALYLKTQEVIYIYEEPLVTQYKIVSQA